MKITLLTIVSIFAIQANAGIPFVGSLKTTRVKNTLACTDYTGKWEGTCTYTDSTNTNTYPADMDFEMWSCDSAIISKNSYPFNGTKVETSSSKLSTSSSVITLEWNDNGKKEFINFTVNSKNMYFDQAQKYDWNGTGTFKIINGKLHMDQKTADGATIACEYSKK